MTGQSRLTVVLANYNHARFLPESLGSLLKQTRPADELIVIDDASTDDSIAVIERLIAGVPSARLDPNPLNLGTVRTMNRGLALATGDLVFFAAADDVFYPGLFADCVDLMQRHPQAALCSTLCDTIDAAGRRAPFATPVPLTEAGYIAPNAAAQALMRDDGWFMGNVTVYRRASLDAEGGFDPALGAFCDGFIARVLALKHGACFVPRVLGAWRRLPGGLAWTQAVDTRKADVFARVGEAIHAHGDVFPPGYLDRWQRRHRFGAERMVMSVRAQHRGGSALRRVVGALADRVRVAALFLQLRPFDIIPALRRHAAAFSRRRA